MVELKTEDISVVLDPSEIKDLIIQTERKRLREGNIEQKHSLFDLQISTGPSGSYRMSRIGQQDCKDFFFCLSENRESWEDVFG